MRRRWVWMLCCLCVAVVGGFLFLMLLPPTDRVTLEGYNEIKQGMAEAEIERLLGRPPDETETTANGQVVYRDRATGNRSVESYTSCKEWEGPNGRIWVFFRDGVVVSKLGDQFGRHESLFERIWRMVGLS